MDALVIEISSFQLQNCRTFKPRVAALLNFSPNHLDYHADMSREARTFARPEAAALIVDGLEELRAAA